MRSAQAVEVNGDRRQRTRPLLEAQLSRRIALAALAASTSGLVGANRAASQPSSPPAATPKAGVDLVHRGMTYDVGTNFSIDIPDYRSHEGWTLEYMRDEIAVIREDLHCTSVSVFGTDIDRLRATGEVAADHGLSVWVQPRLVDAGAADLLDHLAEAATVAAELRTQGADVVFNVGCELAVFAAGIFPGRSFADRIVTVLENLDRIPAYVAGLNDLLADAVTVARGIFPGPLTYSAVEWEQIDWTMFDMIGLNQYPAIESLDAHVAELRTYRRFALPIVITEFGACAYEGATAEGSAGYDIIDWEADPPSLNGDYVRSEETQAEYIATMLDLFAAEGMHGAFVYTFLESSPYSPDPRYDFDMACYGVVKIFPEDTNRGYIATGHWEPKLAFHRIARLYGSNDGSMHQADRRTRPSEIPGQWHGRPGTSIR